jgi:transposase InsO family protein
MSLLESNNKLIKNKVGLLNLAQELGNISKACKMMGFSRDTFYRYRMAVEEGGVEKLIDKSKRVPNIKNRTEPFIEDKVCALAIEYPAYGQIRISNELRKEGINFSHAGVRSVWKRNNLETMKKRLLALEEKVAKEGCVLTEAQLAALERKKEEQQILGEIETEHPGYLGSQDTFYVGTLKGVGRIYQQSFVDTFSKIAKCKLYQMKTPLTAADCLNDKVLPFYDEYNVPLLRILTDRGTEYCGKESHDYQLFLAINDVNHTKTKARHPQTNGIVERFHRTILGEFYQVAFRKKIYTSIAELQVDLDEWIDYYNNERPHQGKQCNGKTPMKTFLEGLEIVKNKIDFPNQISKRETIFSELPPPIVGQFQENIVGQSLAKDFGD